MEWICVNDKLSNEGEDVIIYSENKYGVIQGYRNGKNWYDIFDNSAGRVTHWMPLPETPKK